MKFRNNIRILAALLRKEVNLLRRNPIIPKIIIVMPVMVMLVLPLVATLDVKNVGVAVVDNDRSQLSRRVTADMDATEELVITGVYSTHSEAVREVENGGTDVIVTFPPDWSRTMSQPDVEANGVNAIKGMLGSQYVAGSISASISQWERETGVTTHGSDLTASYRYNPTLNFRNFMIPALMVILLIILCGFVPALSLVSEKESGTIEAMNVTPVGRLTFVLSKLIPFWVVGMIVITVGMTIGWLVYGLRPLGNIGAIYLASFLFSLVMSGLGVTIANRSATMLQSIFMMFAFVMIFQLMGGLFTPISSMPGWAQAITYAVPPRYFNEIMRSIYLKGASVADLWPQFLALAATAAIVCALAAATYRKTS